MLLGTAVASACYAQSLGTFTVHGYSNPFLASAPNGSTCCSGGYATNPLDSAPAESPVRVTGFQPGDVLTFAVTGSMSYNGGTPTDPPDGKSGSNTTIGPGPKLLGPYGNFTITLGQYTGPFNALLGVFLAGRQPATQPPALDFSTGTGIGFTALAPQIGQVFFIGDGLTGTGTGRAQKFTAPVGATTLYLGGADGYCYAGNTGVFSVTVTDTGNPAALALGPVYVNAQDATERLQLNRSGNSFSLREGGQDFSGTWAVSGNVLRLHIAQLGKDVDIAIDGKRLIVNGVEIWVQPN